MKKKVLIILLFLLIIIGVGFGVVVSYYNKTLNQSNMGEKSENNEEVVLVVKQGMTSREIIDSIYNAGLLENKYVGYTYIKLNKNINLQAGTYSFSKDMSFVQVLEKISSGQVVDDSIAVTFVEGKRLSYFVKVISTNFGYTEDEIMDKITNTDYLKKLIDKYWFLTDDILNDKLYFALEGYLYPNTYLFNEKSTIEEVIEKLLDSTSNELSAYKESILNSNYTVHEILTLASIVELEGANSDDRAGVAGVFYNRLNNGWSLGSDVTTYYAAQIDFGDRDLYQYEIDDVNDYNTRVAAMAGKLPVGPICSPSKLSINSVLNPGKHDYFYFVADKNKKTYFSKNYNEHVTIINQLKRDGLWFVYE